MVTEHDAAVVLIPFLVFFSVPLCLSGSFYTSKLPRCHDLGHLLIDAGDPGGGADGEPQLGQGLLFDEAIAFGDAGGEGIALPVVQPLERCRKRLGCDTAIYVGDDETDEDAFAFQRPGRLLAVRVGAKRDSAAAYFVPDQPAVDELLRVLVAERAERTEGRRRA